MASPLSELTRIAQGHGSLAAAFGLSFFIVGTYLIYEYYANIYSIAHESAYRFFRLVVYGYPLLALHNCSRGHRIVSRLLVEVVVVLIAAWATFNAYVFYGEAGLLYPLVVIGVGIAIKDH